MNKKNYLTRKGVYLVGFFLFLASFIGFAHEAQAVCSPSFSISVSPSPANPSVGQSITLQITGSDICDTYEIVQVQGTNVIGGSSSIYVNSTGFTTSYTTNPLPSAGTYTFDVYGYDSGTGGTIYGGSASVTATGASPTVDIKANNSNGPITVATNIDAVNLSWTSTNTSSCSASGAWSGSKSTNGSQNMGVLSSMGTYTYTITCSGTSGGNATDSVTVTSDPPLGTASASVSCVGSPPADPEMNISWTPYPSTPNPPNRYDLFRTTPTRNLLSSGGATSYVHTTSGSYPLVYGVAPSYQLEITDATNIIYDAFPFGAPVPTCDATINVNITGTTSPVTWTIQPENKTGAGNGAVTVRPTTGGNIYTITPQSFSGCTFSVTNSLGGGSSMTMTPGANRTFTVAYSCSVQPPSCSLSPSSSSISSGQSVTLNWSSTNASSASASANPANAQWSGSKSPVASGNQTITNLTQSTTFYLDVSGTGGNFQCSAPVTVTGLPPAPPTGLTANPGSCGSGTITLSWNASSGATSYNVLRSTTSGGPYSTIAPGVTGTSYVDSGRTAGVTYYYVVQAVNANGASANSSQASAVGPNACVSNPTPTITATPDSCGTGTVNLTWSAVGASNYVVTRDGVTIYNGSGTSFSDSGRTANQTYLYAVTASFPTGSNTSASVNGTAPNACSGGVVSVSLVASPNTVNVGGNTTLTWTSTNATSCFVPPSAPATAANWAAGSTKSLNGSQSVGPLNTAGTNTFILRCMNAFNTTDASDVVQVSAGTATVNVTSNMSSNWMLTGGAWPLFGSGTGNSFTVYPVPSGTTYTLNPASISGHTVQVTNSKGGTTAMSVTPNTTESFNIVYTATSTASLGVDIVGAPGSTSWSITPGSISGSGGNGSYSYTVTPAAGGTIYTITPTNISGYTYSVSLASGASRNWAQLFPGSSERFIVTYTPNTNLTVNIVGAPSSTTWSIPAASINGSGGNGNYPYAVTPASGGTSYIIVPGSITNYNVAVTNSQGGGSSMTLFGGNSASFTVTYSPVSAPFDFSLTPVNSSVSVTAGGSVQNIINVNLVSGTTQAVTLTATGQPGGVTVSYANQGCSPTCSGTLTFNVPIATTPGTYPINVSGTGGSVTRNAVPFNLVVNPPAGFSVVCSASPTVAQVGQPVTWTATPAGGTGPYTYSWSGTDVPPTPAPTANPYVITYLTTGLKTGSVTATDTATSATANCASQNVQVNVKPILQEF